jgi:(p)ppGpp synthase/HD superfamily hydrolase
MSEQDGTFLDAYFGRDPDDAMYQRAPAEPELMTEVDATVQHGRASAIASIAHRGQTDKLGHDYIDHPARVAETFNWLDHPAEHCAAWLHDVIEDSDVTAADLRNAGILPEIVEAVELLTRRADVADDVYYERIRQHPVARAVKLADIADNLADWRFRKLDHETQERLPQKYFRARQLLEQEES